MKVYTASGWIAASSASVATLATFEFVATSGQTVFTGADANGATLSYVAPALIVTLNGVRLRPGDDYTATNGTSITLVSAAALNDELVVDAFGSFLVANTYTIAQADATFVTPAGSQTLTNKTINASQLVNASITQAKLASGVGNTGPAFNAQLTSNQSISASTYSKLIFNNAVSNVGGCYDPTTNYRFTPTTAGYYFISAVIYGSGYGSTNATIYLVGNGGAQSAQITNFQSGYGYHLVLNKLQYFNGSTDYAEIWWGSGTTEIIGGGINSQFNGFFIRP